MLSLKADALALLAFIYCFGFGHCMIKPEGAGEITELGAKSTEARKDSKMIGLFTGHQNSRGSQSYHFGFGNQGFPRRESDTLLTQNHFNSMRHQGDDYEGVAEIALMGDYDLLEGYSNESQRLEGRDSNKSMWSKALSLMNLKRVPATKEDAIASIKKLETRLRMHEMIRADVMKWVKVFEEEDPEQITEEIIWYGYPMGGIDKVADVKSPKTINELVPKFQKKLDKFTKLVGSLHEQARIHETSGSYDEAVRCIEKALRIAGVNHTNRVKLIRAGFKDYPEEEMETLSNETFLEKLKSKIYRKDHRSILSTPEFKKDSRVNLLEKKEGHLAKGSKSDSVSMF